MSRTGFWATVFIAFISLIPQSEKAVQAQTAEQPVKEEPGQREIPLRKPIPDSRGFLFEPNVWDAQNDEYQGSENFYLTYGLLLFVALAFLLFGFIIYLAYSKDLREKILALLPWRAPEFMDDPNAPSNFSTPSRIARDQQGFQTPTLTDKTRLQISSMFDNLKSFGGRRPPKGPKKEPEPSIVETPASDLVNALDTNGRITGSYRRVSKDRKTTPSSNDDPHSED